MKMKINISRQHVYLLALSIFLLLFVFIFSFGILIPEGKVYRQQRTELRKENKELIEYKNFHDETFKILKNLQSENRHIIVAFDNTFKVQKFQKQHKSYFSSLKLSKLAPLKSEKNFTTYEVNTTSHISSPKSFYNFLEGINKSDWIINIDFPIIFVRGKDYIESSFKMKVYKLDKKLNKK